MASANVRVWTQSKVQGSENKFYRSYLIEGTQTHSINQWGSQKNGRSGGQFKAALGSTLALGKRDEKAREGYQRVADEYNIVFPIDDVAFLRQLNANGSKSAGIWLEGEFLRALQRGTPAPTAAGQQLVSCADCGETFANRQALVAHRRNTPDCGNTHGAVQKPETVEVIVDPIGDLSKEAQSVIALATTDPINAHVKLVELRERKSKIELDLRRVGSYLDTIETLVEEA